MYSRTLVGKFVTLYGISIAFGIFMCFIVLRFLGKKQKVDKQFLDNVELIGYLAIAGGFLGSWLFQVYYNYADTGVWDFKSSGITFLGGLIGGVVTFISIYLIFRKQFTGRITDILPIAPCVITIAHGFGRVGCFFAGCCGGIEADVNSPFYIFSVRFPNHAHNTYPTQLFEAIFLFLIFGLMFYLLYKKNFKYNFVIYLIGYGFFRYFIEFIRGDERGKIISSIDFLSPSQFWALIMVLLSIPVYILLNKLYKARDKELLNKN